MSLIGVLFCLFVDGKVAITDSPLRNAPHTMDVVTSTEWNK